MRYEYNFDKDNYKNGIEWNKNFPKDILKYAIGGLLYSPATAEILTSDLKKFKYNNVKSIALCMEDAIHDNGYEYAEEKLVSTLKNIYLLLHNGEITINDIPLIFIRVRNSILMKDIFDKIKDYAEVITGFILPKYDGSNAQNYEEVLNYINSKLMANNIYIMPILESINISNLHNRSASLLDIKNYIDNVKDQVLNIRVGGNDFCNHFGFRRSSFNTIYDIGVIKNIFSDIINVFNQDYIISGPVWEYFENGKDDSWIIGLKRELEQDKLNGFIGKTAIHPSQLKAIQESLMIDYNDYVDAYEIINWKNDIQSVGKSILHGRMNEQKVHQNWANKVLNLAEIYGVKPL